MVGQVSHWGNVAFEEFFEVHHAGAKLKGGFSRLEFMVRTDHAAFPLLGHCTGT